MNKSSRLLLLGLLALFPVRAFGLHRETPQFQVVSSLNPGGSPSLPGLGTSGNPFSQGGLAGWCSFESEADLKQLGATFAGGRQVFLFDNNPDNGGRHIIQVTNKAGTSANPSVTGTGSVVAFDSDARLLNVGPVGVKQIYTWSRASQTTTQWTFGNRDSSNPVLNARGKAMVFLSKADLRENGSSGTQLFLWKDRPSTILGIEGSGQLHQLTPVGNSTTANAVFSPENAGTLVLFDTDAPIGGPSNGRRQIVLVNLTDGQYERVTNYAGGDSVKPSISDGEHRWLTFQSNADPLGNGSNGWEIFLKDRQTGELRQITNSPVGDSTEPSLSVNAGYVLFVSTSDLLQNGSQQRNVFFSDLRTGNTYQMTKDSTDPGNPSDAHNPVAAGDRLFFFDTTAKVFGVGNGFRQVVGMNVFNWLPGPALGQHEFQIAPGTATGGSKASVKSSVGEVILDLDAGQLDIAFGARFVDGQAGISIPTVGMQFPPIPMQNFGAMCIVPRGDGAGTIDCNGGHDDLNVSLVRDRVTDDSDPFCQFGCRENETCSGPLQGSHVRPCEYCVKRCVGGTLPGAICQDSGECGGGICSGECTPDSVLAGEACTADPEICNPVEACDDGLRGVCVGPEVTAAVGDFGSGAARVTLPVAIAFSNNAGLDGAYCTADDSYPLPGVDVILNLTTGASTTTLKDADAVAGVDRSTTLVGQPFECNEIVTGNMNGAAFVGTFHILNVPLSPQLNDLVIGLSLSSGGCTVNCPTPCTADAECSDGNACTGTETCGLDHFCKSGTPVMCSNDDACDGLETCNPTDGTCQGGVAPNCDDSSLCTIDSCAPAVGCLNVDLNVQNGNLCDGIESCDPSTGNTLPGTPPVCNDSNPCNGVETCAAQFGCLSGPPIVCSNGNACDGLETCNPGDGSCQPGTSLACDDGLPCNGVETCNPLGGCLAGAPIVCTDGNQCNGAESCEPSTGSCVAGTTLGCDDSNSCTTDSCDGGLGCVHDPLPGYTGIHCILNLMVGELNNVPGGSSLTPKLHGKLRRMVAKVIGRVDAAERSALKFRVRHARTGVKVLRGIVRSVMAGEAVGTCSGPICEEIRQMAEITTTALQPLAVRP